LLKNKFKHISCIEDLTQIRGRSYSFNSAKPRINYVYALSMFVAKSMRFVFVGVFLILSGVINVSAESSWQPHQDIKTADIIIKSPSDPDIKTVVSDMADYGVEFKKISKEIEGEIYKKLSLIMVGEEIDIYANKQTPRNDADSWSVLQNDGYKDLLNVAPATKVDISPDNVDIAKADGFNDVKAPEVNDADAKTVSESSFIPLYEEMLEHEDEYYTDKKTVANSDEPEDIQKPNSEVVLDKQELPLIDVSKVKSDNKQIQLASLAPTNILKDTGNSSPDWKKYAVKITPDKNIKHYVAVIIDDMGLDIKRTNKIADLPAPLTLSYLSYAAHLDKQTKKAHGLGHELMVHMPMEPNGTRFDPGPNALRIDMDKAELDKNIDKMLASFTGYVGVNNHMGSKFTRNRKSMGVLMAELKKRGLLFVDSQTTSSSVGVSVARRFDVPHATRNVFIDNLPSKAYAMQQLKIAERKSLKNGYAVVIGHPRDGTIEALQEWLPSLKEKNIELVPISFLVK